MFKTLLEVFPSEPKKKLNQLLFCRHESSRRKGWTHECTGIAAMENWTKLAHTLEVSAKFRMSYDCFMYLWISLCVHADLSNAHRCHLSRSLFFCQLVKKHALMFRYPCAAKSYQNKQWRWIRHSKMEPDKWRLDSVYQIHCQIWK